MLQTVESKLTLAWIVVALALVAALATACEGSNPTATGSTPAAPAAVVYDGTWTSVSTEGDPVFKATIAANTISVVWMMDATTSGLYWQGTFPNTPDTIISVADRTALDASMVGSQDVTKTFTYKDGKLSYHFSALGIGKTIILEK